MPCRNTSRLTIWTRGDIVEREGTKTALSCSRAWTLFQLVSPIFYCLIIRRLFLLSHLMWVPCLLWTGEFPLPTIGIPGFRQTLWKSFKKGAGNENWQLDVSAFFYQGRYYYNPLYSFLIVVQFQGALKPASVYRHIFTVFTWIHTHTRCQFWQPKTTRSKTRFHPNKIIKTGEAATPCANVHLECPET